jgi:hemolysin activation/secretion protein
MYSMSSAFRTNSGTFGLNGSYFGFAESNQTQLSLAYGRKVSSTVDVGASFHYHAISQAGIYGNSSAITGSLSMLWHLSEKIMAGFNVYNPFRAQWSKTTDDERLPSRYTFGLGYDASEKFFLTGELEKEEGQEVNVNLAIHYQLIPQVFIRGGIASLTSSYFAGLGIQLSDFRVDFATSFHPQLGVSPGVVLLYQFGKKSEEPGK